MDFELWKDTEWTDESYAEFREQAIAALEEFLCDIDMTLHKVLPTKFYLNAVITNHNHRKWIQIKTPDVHDFENWSSGVSLRRMSSERDWRNINFHFCSWNELEDRLVKYMSDEYDDDIFDKDRD